MLSQDSKSHSSLSPLSIHVEAAGQMPAKPAKVNRKAPTVKNPIYLYTIKPPATQIKSLTNF